MPLVFRRAVPAVSAALVAIALLAGCTPQPTPTEPAGGPNPSGDPTGEPAPSMTAQPTGTPVSQSCDDLVSAETIYIYNPNFGLIDFTPAEGSVAESAVAYNGVACRWQNQTSGDNIDLSVAHLDEASLTALKNTAFETSELVPTYGDEAYFSVGSNGVGTAQVFDGPYWIVVESPAFFEPGDATEIVDSVIAGLGA
jgi:hypothetical protein